MRCHVYHHIAMNIWQPHNMGMHLNPNEVVQHLQEFFGITEASVVDAIKSSLHKALPDLLTVYLLACCFQFHFRVLWLGDYWCSSTQGNLCNCEVLFIGFIAQG